MEWDKNHKYLSFHSYLTIHISSREAQVSCYFFKVPLQRGEQGKSMLLEVRTFGLTLHLPYSRHPNLVHFLSNLRICFLLKISSESLFYLLWCCAILNIIINVGFFFVTLNRYIYPSTVGSHTVYEANSYSMGIMAILEILNVCLLFLPFHQDLISYSSLNSVKGKKNRIPRTVKGTNHGRKHIEILEIWSVGASW